MVIYGRVSTCKGTCAARKCSATIIQPPLDMLPPKLYVGLRLWLLHVQVNHFV